MSTDHDLDVRVRPDWSAASMLSTRAIRLLVAEWRIRGLLAESAEDDIGKHGENDALLTRMQHRAGTVVDMDAVRRRKGEVQIEAEEAPRDEPAARWPVLEGLLVPFDSEPSLASSATAHGS